MNIVDSCGWLEYFADGPNAKFFAPAIEDKKRLLVPAICIYEVFKRVYQQKGEDLALEAAALMHQGRILDVDETSALFAAKCSLDYKLPMADSIILAMGHINKAVVWTQDIDFKGIDGVKFVVKKKRKK
ncbi:MAG: type II toxin-antitoxin system VapC family toxin [Candidatus Omnitrophota bacterium]